jgi:hypothetical protein
MNNPTSKILDHGIIAEARLGVKDENGTLVRSGDSVKVIQPVTFFLKNVPPDHDRWFVYNGEEGEEASGRISTPPAATVYSNSAPKQLSYLLTTGYAKEPSPPPPEHKPFVINWK